ncbi:MAG: hypothetical protein WBL20_03025 [Sphingobium sp.]|uniref:hypothetical protein n=1 Tax=Sphingobium sp. TaxID=1912891 RepID=UPI002E1C6409
MIRRTFYKADVLCSAEGCDVPVGKGQLFCKGHYFSLPRALRDALWGAWRAAMNARRDCKPRVEQAAANAAYQVAFQNCCEHLRTARATTAEAMTTVAIAADGERVTYANGRML